MTPRVRQWTLLGLSVVVFSLVVSLIAVSVLQRRHDRDLEFGLEKLDGLIADDRITEAQAMVPWLANRADEALEMLSVLKRGVALLELTGNPVPLDEAARSAVAAFPGNRTIRTIGIYAAVKAGDIARAREWSRTHLSGPGDGALFAWVILQDGASGDAAGVDAGSWLGEPDESDESGDQGFLLLASLASDGQVADFERAWRMTGDWRYAADGAILAMRAGDGETALRLTRDASLALYAPRLAADVLADRGEHEAALAALRSLRSSAPATELLVADALMRLGRRDQAGEIYQRLVRVAPELSVVPHLNLAWLTSGSNPAQALALYDRAVELFPASWPAAEQRALLLASTDRHRAYASLAAYAGSDAGPRRKLLELQLDPRLGQRGYEAALWDLVTMPGAPPEACRFAAWYFASRGDSRELSEILARAPDNEAWVSGYAGLLAAENEEWERAAAQLLRTYRQLPTWRTALNAALSALRAGDTRAGRELLEDAERRARLAGLPRASADVFVAIAREATDRRKAYEAIGTALRVNPTSTRAVVLRSQLESGSGY